MGFLKTAQYTNDKAHHYGCMSVVVGLFYLKKNHILCEKSVDNSHNMWYIIITERENKTTQGGKQNGKMV